MPKIVVDAMANLRKIDLHFFRAPRLRISEFREKIPSQRLVSSRQYNLRDLHSISFHALKQMSTIELSSFAQDWVFCPWTERHLVSLLLDIGEASRLKPSLHRIDGIKWLSGLLSTLKKHWTPARQIRVGRERAVIAEVVDAHLDLLNVAAWLKVIASLFVKEPPLLLSKGAGHRSQMNKVKLSLPRPWFQDVVHYFAVRKVLELGMANSIPSNLQLGGTQVSGGG